MKMKMNALAVAAAMALSACNMMHSMDDKMSGHAGEHVTLSGANEVPPVQTSASGNGTVKVNSDRTVRVELKVSGMNPTAAHIHTGAAGANGGVIIPLQKKGENEFVSGPDAKFNEEQYEAYKTGRTYVNVHSEKYKNGEIRAQLKGG